MSILTVFNIPSMNTERYDQVIKDLEAAGQGEDGIIIVTDVWESAELLGEFGSTLLPVVENAGVTPVEPIVYSVHNVIQG